MSVLLRVAELNAAYAATIDTDRLDIDQVVDLILKNIAKRQPK